MLQPPIKPPREEAMLTKQIHYKHLADRLIREPDRDKPYDVKNLIMWQGASLKTETHKSEAVATQLSNWQLQEDRKKTGDWEEGHNIAMKTP